MWVVLGVLAAQAAYAAFAGWVWERHDRRWKHVPTKLRTAVLVGAILVMPNVIGFAYLVTKVEQRLRRRRRVYAALMDMNRRRDERGAAERCPRCGEYHF